VFDFRYHVASLAAVFVALVIGILVGVGLSGKGFVDDAERANLTRDIADLRAERDRARALLEVADRQQEAMQEFAVDAYPALVPGRLREVRVAVLYIGSIDQTIDFAITRAVRDAGGNVVRVRAVRVPADVSAMQEAIMKRPALARYLGTDLADVGHDLGTELVAGGKMPLWDALDEVIVEERERSSTTPADAVVVARPAAPQHARTGELLAALYRGLARSRVPAVGVERGGVLPSAVPAFQRGGLSTVDSVETPAGRLALVILLGGGQPGDYGVDLTASDGILPPVPPATVSKP
jgi:hypothetical protein